MQSGLEKSTGKGFSGDVTRSTQKPVLVSATPGGQFSDHCCHTGAENIPKSVQTTHTSLAVLGGCREQYGRSCDISW